MQIIPVTPKGRATRARLIEAARTVALTSDGHIEVAAVAEEAGVAPSLVHKYFSSKAGLVCALVDDYFDRFHSRVFSQDTDDDSFDDQQTWAKRERARLEAGVRFHYHEPLAVVIYGQLVSEPEVTQLLAQHTTTIVSRAARSIRKAQKAGELPVGIDPGIAGAAMFGAMRQVMVEALTRSSRPSQKNIVETLWHQVAAAVRIDPVN